jgi:stress-induced morphogen
LTRIPRPHPAGSQDRLRQRLVQWERKQAAAHPFALAYRPANPMALRILNSSIDSEPLVRDLRERIERELPNARARVRATAAGHFEIEVECAAFAGKPRVRQHQMVYAAIAPLMKGDAAPVHAVDKLDCQVP